MNNFIMFIGLPGSGKTTFIGNNESRITSTYGVDCVISSDAVIEDVANARGLTYSEVFADSVNLAGKYIEAMLGILSLQQKNFILDQTNLTPKSRQRKLGLLVHPANYNRIAVVFGQKDEVLIDRLNKRANVGGKIIPTEVLNTMRRNYIAPKLEEGFTKIMTVEEFEESLNASVNSYGGAKFA
jgi:predicted kinase